ncbi:mesenchyme-specific cell surface glycoprotein-like [Aplysia californica]|uniref:Mesenchyme-specific cell surface glycoprotein-like n=1 Tax=Aplysia californica TaxID=6500 RepID=A0ABM0JE56_APLCA|nr:mesenchyme-specific cell surface glycoprotein-like [Aplysia californica]
MKWTPVVLCCWLLAATVTAYVVLKPKAYVRLNDADGNKRINSSTLNTLDFDYVTNLLYVLAHEPARLTVFSLSLDGTPTQVLEHKFSTALEGFPLDIEICRPLVIGSTPRVAISFQDPASRSADGRVVFFQPLSFNDKDLVEIQRVTVGPYPVDLEFAEDCSVLIVANKGQATKEGTNIYRDPEGTLTRVQMPPDFSDLSPITSTTISFADYFDGPAGGANLAELLAGNFRSFPVRDPNNGLLSIAQNIEPEDVLIAEGGRTAYVTLPMNNAVAKVNLFTNQVSEIFPLGNRSWTDYYMDPSDMDGGVNMRGFNIYSLYQARRIEWISQGTREFLITLDSGLFNINHEYGFMDFERGKTLQSAGVFDTGDQKLESELADDTMLGRLAISTVDGVRLDGRIENVFTFGGRGFSIHSGQNLDIRSATVDSIEKVTKQYMPDVFNSAYRSPTSNPQRDRESTSPFLGPYLQAMTVAEFQDKTVLFLGSGNSGIIYVYVLSADATCPQPYFHSLYRAGGKYSTWQTLYDTEAMGDIGINDMRYLEDIDLTPILVVTSSISNSVSIYHVEEGPFDSDSSV